MTLIVTEFAKFAARVKRWRRPALIAYFVCLALLYKHTIGFNEAVILILLSVLFVPTAPSAKPRRLPNSKTHSGSGVTRNLRRRQ